VGIRLYPELARRLAKGVWVGWRSSGTDGHRPSVAGALEGLDVVLVEPTSGFRFNRNRSW
jgi:hypothetical protein